MIFNIYHSVNKASNIEKYELLLLRRKILSRLKTYKSVHVDFEEAKVHSKNYSKGCKLCREGNWLCYFVTQKCNLNCFYCSQDRNKDTSYYIHRGFEMNTSEQINKYLSRFDIKGLAISGGEPLLVLDKTLSIISNARNRFKKNLYIWMYTNSTLLTKEIALKLKDAGLDEIRFNASALDYDLSKFLIVKDMFKNLSVEIPMIPGDEEKVKKLILDMSKHGIKYLNLHEFHMNKINCGLLNSKNFKIIIDPKFKNLMSDAFFPVYGSEISALKMIEFVEQNNLNVSVNFCSNKYQSEIQGQLLKAHEQKQKT